MYCPQCRTEYLQGVIICPDCDSRLVTTLVPESVVEAEYTELVTVFSTASPNAYLVAKSLMESADIDYYAKGDVSSDLIVGKLGFNVAVGAYEIQVRPEDEEPAREILADMDKEVEELPEDGE